MTSQQATRDQIDLPDMTLYHMPLTRSTRVVWALLEMDMLDKVKIEQVNLKTGIQYEPSFIKINPMSAVPVMVLKDTVSGQSTTVTESAAICTFLADLDSEGKLKPCPTNMLALGQYHRFISFAVASMDALLWEVRQHEQLLPADQRREDVAQRARHNFKTRVLKTLVDVLETEGVEYLCEPHHQGLTTADIMVAYSLWWASNVYNLLEGFPVLKRYLERVTDRPAFEEALKRRSTM